MQIIRRGPGEASLAEGEHNLLDLVATETGNAEFDALLDRLEAALSPKAGLPRLVLVLQEGLPGAVQADQPLELVVIEEDQHDLPPTRITRRAIAPDPAALAVLLDRAERRAARGAA